MTNKEAIEYLKDVKWHIDLEMSENTQKMYDAIDMAIKALEDRPTGKCGKCEYYRNNYGYGQCFAQKNAPRVDYNHSCENFKYKEWEGQWVTLRCTNCHDRTKLHISSRIGIYSLAEFKKKHIACLKCGADMKVVRQRKENRGNG